MKKLLVFLAVLIFVAFIAYFALSPKRHTTTNAVNSSPTISLISLGDSVAAGVGLSPDSDFSACDRTDQAYPNQIAHDEKISVHNLACTAATLPAGIIGPQTVNRLKVPAQLAQLFALPKPSYITITVGANDADWTGFIAKCYASVCGSPADTLAATNSQNTVSQNLQATLKQIGDHYGPDAPHVIVTGYHEVFPVSAHDCPDLVGIDAAELSWGRQQQTNLNSAIQAAVATANFAVFAPVDFTGHELCSTDSWVQGINDKQPYHPTASGQAAYAREITSKIR